MKHFLLVVFMVLAVGLQAQPALVDLTPGGYESGHFPSAFWKFIDAQSNGLYFFDEAAQGWFDTPQGRRYFNNWVSLYGDLNGGQYFFTNLFALHSPRNAVIWWNFVNAPRGYKLGYIHVWGRKSNGQAWEHLYLVRQWLAGEAQVTVDGATGIQSIGFYGYEP